MVSRFDNRPDLSHLICRGMTQGDDCECMLLGVDDVAADDYFRLVSGHHVPPSCIMRTNDDTYPPELDECVDIISVDTFYWQRDEGPPDQGEMTRRCTAYQAAQRQIRRTKRHGTMTCPTCKGDGGRNDSPDGWYWIDCGRCNGSGKVPVEDGYDIK